MQWFLQVTLAVRYMHSRTVLHRDLKTENVFMNKSATLCKLGASTLARGIFFCTFHFLLNSLHFNLCDILFVSFNSDNSFSALTLLVG